MNTQESLIVDRVNRNLVIFAMWKGEGKPFKSITFCKHGHGCCFFFKVRKYKLWVKKLKMQGFLIYLVEKTSKVSWPT